MYVWKNVSKRDRRTQPVAPAELHLTKQKTVLAEVEGTRGRASAASSRRSARSTRSRRPTRWTCLGARSWTSCWLIWRLIMGNKNCLESSRRYGAEQDLAEELQKRREIETLKEQEKREAEDHAFGKAYAARKRQPRGAGA